MYDFWRGGTGETVRRPGCGCLSMPGSTVWLFFTLMYFFTEADALPAGKWESVWRVFARPFNFLF